MNLIVHEAYVSANDLEHCSSHGTQQ